jgi:hypothetical protein
MIIKISVALMFCLAFLADGCESKPGGAANTAPSNTQQTASASPANSLEVKSEGRPAPVANPANGESGANAVPDICALIEKSEIASVQGQPVQAVAPSHHTTGGLNFSQCYYTVMSADGSKNLSVHLQVIRSAAKNPSRKAVRDFWEEKLKHENGRSEEEEREAGKPLPISGLGDEAFWMGNNVMGAIYAIKNDKIVRVSVGGPGDAKTRIEKSKTLAQKSLQRLK